MKIIGATATAQTVMLIKRLLQSVADVVWPPLCPCCGAVMVRGEKPMCLSCRLSLPLTGDELSPRANELVDKLAGTVPLEAAAAYFVYHRESPHARLIREAKYHGRPSILRELAREFGRILQANGFFNGIEAITYVPLSFRRLCARGYNQSRHIALGLADVAGLPVIGTLEARHHKTQTRRGADERRRAVKGVYSSRPGALAGIRSVLLVDDICTTGSTLYACIEALRAESPQLAVSVCALASTCRF